MVERGTLGQYAAARRRETLEGERPQGRSHGVGLLYLGEADLSEEPGESGLMKRRLGVWVSSEKEFKPRRGPSYLRKRCEGAV